MAISFFIEGINFALNERNKRKKWLRALASDEGFHIAELNYIFCSDEYLWKINVDYLNHDNYTDIITFDTSEEEYEINGDIFISIDRVYENALNRQIPRDTELTRVISHGLLHLMGYKDKNKKDARVMRELEDRAIALYESI
ncbi:rRNA maturation RNase YbeY [Algoriphagus namhaensis]